MGACTSLPAEEDAAPPDDPAAESPTVVVKPVLKADIIAEAEVELQTWREQKGLVAPSAAPSTAPAARQQ